MTLYPQVPLPPLPPFGQVRSFQQLGGSTAASPDLGFSLVIHNPQGLLLLLVLYIIYIVGVVN